MQRREDEVPGQRGMDRDLGGLVVANLSHHDDVGVLPDDGAQAVGERQADVRSHGNLADSGHLVLDRVFDGENVRGGRPDLLERGVQRGGLARAGRAGGENHAVGNLDDLAVALQHVRLDSQLREAEHRGSLVENSHHGPLAEHGWDDAHAHVHSASCNHQLDTPVLR